MRSKAYYILSGVFHFNIRGPPHLLYSNALQKRFNKVICFRNICVLHPYVSSETVRPILTEAHHLIYNFRHLLVEGCGKVLEESLRLHAWLHMRHSAHIIIMNHQN